IGQIVNGEERRNRSEIVVERSARSQPEDGGARVVVVRVNDVRLPIEALTGPERGKRKEDEPVGILFGAAVDASVVGNRRSGDEPEGDVRGRGLKDIRGEVASSRRHREASAMLR